jgi:hypothetical protein
MRFWKRQITHGVRKQVSGCPGLGAGEAVGTQEQRSFLGDRKCFFILIVEVLGVYMFITAHKL